MVAFQNYSAIETKRGIKLVSFVRMYYIFSFLKDLFAVGMLLPLFNRRGRELGGSPSMIGLVG